MLRMFATNSLYRGLRIEDLDRVNRFLKAQGIEPFTAPEVNAEMDEENKRQSILHRVIIARQLNGKMEYRKGGCWTENRADAEVLELTEAGIGDRWCKIYDEDPSNRVLLWVEPEADPSAEEKQRVAGYLDLLKNLADRKRR